MSLNPTLSELRAEYGQSRRLAMPIAGTIVWTVVGGLGAILPIGHASLALFICNGMVFPLAMLVGRFIGEDLFAKTNELDNLFMFNIAMAILFFSIAIPFWMIEPSSLPLSVGVLSGSMWIPFSWILQHWIGLFHGITRTILIVAAWYIFPAHRFVVIPAIIVVIYLISIYVLATRSLPSQESDNV